MSQEFFKTLPSELVINILSRLPLRAIAICRGVCKPWLDLIANHDFSALAPVLVFNPFESTLRLFELEDGPYLDVHHHDRRYKALIEFRFPRKPIQIKSSVNGLLLLRLLRARSTGPVVLYICNPITREYIEIEGFVHSSRELVTYGFGASKLTGQYKVATIIHDRDHPRTSGFSKFECHVYTVGTGSWRRVRTGPPLDYSLSSSRTGAFCNGNLHWMVHDPKGLLQISCFDLETECFTTFSAPPRVPSPPLSHGHWAKSLYSMEDRLCLCDNSSYAEIVIWSMKTYGDEKSWMKEFVISKRSGFEQGLVEPVYPNLSNRSYLVHPIKVFKDGDVLIAWGDFFLVCYSNEAKTTRKIDMFKPSSSEICIKAVLHTPSFLSLSFFPLENVNSF